jgi:hypothetical protein
VGERVHADGAHHDEGERGIERAERIEEGQNLGRLAHAAQEQARTENDAGGERREAGAQVAAHDAPPSKRTSVAVSMPTRTKVIVATIASCLLW